MAIITPKTTYTRILCPECKGSKSMMYDVVKTDNTFGYERMLLCCQTCSGEGIVEEVKTIEYKRI